MESLCLIMLDPSDTKSLVDVISQRSKQKPVSAYFFLSDFIHIVTPPLCCQCRWLPTALRREMRASTVRSVMVRAQLILPADLGGLAQLAGTVDTKRVSALFTGAFCRFGFPQAMPRCHGPAKQGLSCSGPKLVVWMWPS